VLERTEASGQLLEVSADDKVLAPLPLPYHFVASALSFLRAGATIIDCASLSPSEILLLGATHGATIMYASPMQYELLSRAGGSDTLATLRRAISTSSLLSASIAERFQERFGIRLTQVYGIIEVGLPIWNSDSGSPAAALGRCAPPYAAEVRDDHGLPVSSGAVGELFVRGPGLFAGYLTGYGSSAPISRDSWFATGDLVSRDASGLITFRGRRKSVINSGGNKVFPEEVEAVLRRAPEIREVRVSAEPHPILGQLVIAEVVIKEGMPWDIQGWRALCYSELSGFKVPKEFRVVQELPQTGSGKLIRHSFQRDPEMVA
jgi:acyl-coenzyme A synthetase/AMP-(fatty) acid ligase